MVFVGALLLSACGADTQALLLDTPTPPPVAEQPQAGEPEVVTEPEKLTDAETTNEEEQAQAEPTDPPAEPTPTIDDRIPEPELGFERGDPVLKATDPGTFVRSAGKPQLVELFAFW